MEERFVSKILVVGAITNPDKVENSSNADSRVLFKKIYFNKTIKKDHLLMVVCEIFSETIEVITVVDTSKISKYY